MKNFNQQIYALWWATRACSEYLFHLSRSVGAIDIDLVDEFKAARLSTTSISLSRLQAKCEGQSSPMIASTWTSCDVSSMRLDALVPPTKRSLCMCQCQLCVFLVSSTLATTCSPVCVPQSEGHPYVFAHACWMGHSHRVAQWQHHGRCEHAGFAATNCKLYIEFCLLWTRTITCSWR